MDLNKQIIALSDLSCSVCKNFLTFPLMNTKIGKTICGRCYTEKKSENDSNFIIIPALQSILKLLSIPCRYKSAGCNINLPHDDMIDHEENCLHQTYNCPAKNDCSWNGSTMNVLKHFQDYHSDLLFKLDSLRFEYQIDFSIDFEKHLLLDFKSEMFLLQIKVENDNFWCALCYIGDDNKGSKYKYYVKEIRCKTGLCFRIDTEKSVLSKNYMNMIDKDQAINNNNVSLRSLFSKVDDVILKLRITTEGAVDEVYDIDEQLLMQFECPICNLYMVPPINQCTKGHSFCSRCRPNVSQCPTCRGTIGDSRNFTLEAISSRTIFPCFYRSHGCSAVLIGSQLRQHEQQCPLQMYNCVIRYPKCHWQGPYSELVKHLRNTHQVKDSYETKDYYGSQNFSSFSSVNSPSQSFSFMSGGSSTSLSSFSSDVNYKIIVAHDEVFRIGYKYNCSSHTSFWNCQMLRPNNKFKFRVTYNNVLQNIFLGKIAPCLPFTIDCKFFDDSLTFLKSQTGSVGNSVRLDIIKSASTF